jgi:hypothetical protein
MRDASISFHGLDQSVCGMLPVAPLRETTANPSTIPPRVQRDRTPRGRAVSVPSGGSLLARKAMFCPITLLTLLLYLSGAAGKD